MISTLTLQSTSHESTLVCDLHLILQSTRYKSKENTSLNWFRKNVWLESLDHVLNVCLSVEAPIPLQHGTKARKTLLLVSIECVVSEPEAWVEDPVPSQQGCNLYTTLHSATDISPDSFGLDTALKMLAKDFYTEINDETTALAFLRRHELLDEEQCVSPCHRCGGEMKDARKRRRNGEFMPVLRCKNRGCQTFRSVRRGNAFFHFTDLNNKVNCKLSLCQILELTFYFIQDLSYDLVHSLTGRGTEAICDWFNMCREVCTAIVSVQNRGQMGGTEEEPVQIDEARFAGRRKYNRGRMLQGDRAPNSTDSEAGLENNRNHGRRIDGPWVFGLKKGSDCRYFYVQRRDRATLQPIIQREVAEGSVIHSDEWRAYANLNQLNFRHFSVNNQQNFVDPNTGAHTQGIERSWLDAKIRILKKMRGCNQRTLQSHLDYYCWWMMRKEAPDLYLAFLSDVRAVYR